VIAVGHRAWLDMSRRARPLDIRSLRALSPMLILAPHQDDETLGCGGLIASACALGLRPRVAFLTNGAASHPGSRAWPAGRLARTRRREAIAALAVLGVPSGDALFMDWPDAAPFGPEDPGFEEGVSGLGRWASSFDPRSLWATWRGEAHCDHLAAARVAAALAPRLPSVVIRMEYLVWGWNEEGLADESVPLWSLECASTVAVRRRALACHRTQTTGLIADAPAAFRIPPELAALTRRPVEVFLEAA